MGIYMDLLSTYTVAFFGHRYILGNFRMISDPLDELIRDLIRNNEYVEFLVGRNGDFDRIVSSAIVHAKEVRDDNSAHVLVLPYDTAEYRNNRKEFEDFYDEIEICEKASMSHPKGAITVRNREMVDRADLVVFFVENESGGAYKTLEYARKMGKNYINLADGKNTP